MLNTTFAEYQYARPDAAALIKAIHTRTAALKNTDAPQAVLTLLDEQETELAHFDTLFQVAQIRNTIDTSDAFYDAEMEYFNEQYPAVSVESVEFGNALLARPALALDAVRAKYGDLYLYRLAQRKRLTSRENIPNQIEENRLIQEYCQVAGSCTTAFQGETVNFYGLLKFMQNPDRSIRKEAMQSWSALYASVAPKLDDIYSRMITVRCRMAKVLGLRDYTELRYLDMERYDYNRDDVAAFREGIRVGIVPLVNEIYHSRAEKLELDKLHFYDESLGSPEGNAVPQGSVDELVTAAQNMYHELSPETGVYFDFLVKHRLFDLVTGPTKQQGGYCTFMPDFAAPFIFSNFNGTTTDIDTLTHEAGHGFEFCTAWRAGVPREQLFSTSEVAEIHSTSMEYFTHPYMERFFGGSKHEADKYRLFHLQDGLVDMPYYACVDEFQHEVYANEMTDADARYVLWHRLEQKYMPWRDYDGDAFLMKGGFWLQKQHIFMDPFYYIDYALAQMGAYEFYLKDRENHASAWADYLRLCTAGGKYGYRDLMTLAGLHWPFDPATVNTLMEKLRPLLLGDGTNL